MITNTHTTIRVYVYRANVCLCVSVGPQDVCMHVMMMQLAHLLSVTIVGLAPESFFDASI